MTPQTRYDLYVLGSALLAAVGWVLTEVVIRFYHVTPLVLILLGNLVGGMFLLSASFKNFASFRLTWRSQDWIPIIFAALFIYALAFLLSFNAVGLIGAGKSALLGQLQTPFLVVLAIIFLGEHLSPRRWLAGALALSGGILINFDAEALQLSIGWGESMAILGALAVSTGITILKPLLDRVDARWVTGLALLLGALFLIPFIPFYGSSAGLGWTALVIIVVTGTIRGGSWLVYNIALQHIGASRCAIIFLTFAFFTVILQLVVATSSPLLGLQPPANLPMAFVGGGVVTLGIVLLQTEVR